MQSFKMADDVAQKELLMRMQDASVVSRHTLLNQLLPEVNYDKERDYLEKEQSADMEAAMRQQINQANAAMATGLPMNDPSQSMQQDGAAGQQHGDLPSQRPPRAEGGGAQI